MSRKSTPTRPTPPRTPKSSHAGQKQGVGSNKKSLPVFNSYMSLFQVQEKLKKGEVIEGVLRINPKNYEDAYISAPDEAMDIYIGGVLDRNTALHGDIVATTLYPPNQWKMRYDDLDSYLEDHPDLQSLVYKPIDEEEINVLTSEIIKAKILSNSVHNKSSDSDPDVIIEEESDTDVKIEAEEEDMIKGNLEANKNEEVGSSKQENWKKKKKAKRREDKAKLEKENKPEGEESKRKKRGGRGKKKRACEESLPPPVEYSSKGVILVPPPPGVVVALLESSECEEASDDNQSIGSSDEPSAKSNLCRDIEGLNLLDDVSDVTVESSQPSSSSALDSHCDTPVTPSTFKSDNTHLTHSDPSTLAIPKCDDTSPPTPSDPSTPATPKCDNTSPTPSDPLTPKCDNTNPTPSDPLTPKCDNTNPTPRDPSTPKCDDDNAPSTSKITTTSDTPTPSTPKNSGTPKHKNKNHFRTPSKHDGRTEPNVFQVFRLTNWRKFVQKSGKVVRLLEKKHPRLTAGVLVPFQDKNPNMALFSPFDYRVPRLKIPMSQCPSDFLQNHKNYAKNILLARVVVWTEPKFAFGELVRNIGNVGDVSAETEATLLENGIDYSDFPASIDDDLPSLPWTIPQEEISVRTDLRESTIFTIDPSTARDLDDAVSCLKLSSGNFRVGVHIADVSYFVKTRTHLDSVAADRATSVYLTDKVIPMLPRSLCEDLCSLNPGEDRLAFSVIWEMTPGGTIKGEWFGRTVIKSCAKLSYEHAQLIIDNPADKLDENQFPPFYNGKKLKDAFEVVSTLHSIAVKLREKRKQEGALRLDQPKLCFSLDQQTKTPNGIFVYEQKDSNRLIEEFMLLANMNVAHKIHSTFPKISVLRKHPDPHDRLMENAVKLLLKHDIHIDPTSSASLARSIQNYIGDDEKSVAKMFVITNLCSKPMQFAKYFCTGVVTNPDEFRHYALNVMFYTHFTSPIRRYADLMVHRILAAAVDPQLYPPPDLDPMTVDRKASHCNEKRQASKIAQTVSADLYLAQFVKEVGEMVERGVVIGILDKAVDILVFRLGIVKRCYLQKIDLKSFAMEKRNKCERLKLCWNPESENQEEVTQTIAFLDFVSVVLRPFENKTLKINAYLLRPDSSSS